MGGQAQFCPPIYTEEAMKIVCGHCRKVIEATQAGEHVLTHPRRGSVEERITKRLRKHDYKLQITPVKP